MTEAPVSDARELAREQADAVIAQAIKAIENLKGEDIKVLDLTGVCDFADHFLIANGRSERQVQAIAERVERSLREIGSRPLAVEGLRTGTWVLLDYADLIVHIFLPQTRDFYALERLWSDATNITAQFTTTPGDQASPASQTEQAPAEPTSSDSQAAETADIETPDHDE